MTLLDSIKPSTFYKTLLTVFRNYRNWRFYKKTMKRLYIDGYLKQNGMRLDKRHRAYYVLNLEPETLMMGTEVLELERSRVFESLSIKKQLFEKAEVGELIEAKTERIKSDDYYAYLIQIKYRPISSIWSIIYLILWLACAAILMWFAIIGAMQYDSIFTWFNSIITMK